MHAAGLRTCPSPRRNSAPRFSRLFGDRDFRSENRDRLARGAPRRDPPAAAQAAAAVSGGLRGEGREPRADRLQKQFMRLRGDILHRGRVRQQQTGAAHDLGLARDVRQIQFAEDLHGGERLRLGKARAKIRQAALSQRRGDRRRDPLGIKAFGDLRGGATDDPGSKPMLVLQ